MAAELDEGVSWEQAVDWCLTHLAGFVNLTTPMQGMLAGAYIDLLGTDDDWNDRLTSLKLLGMHGTLALCDEVHSTHGKHGWGYEK